MYALVSLFLALVAAGLSAALLPASPWFAPLYFLAYFLGLILLLFLVAILASPLLSKKRVPRKPNAFAHFVLVQAYTIALFVMRIRCRVTGTEHLPPKGTHFLIVCNHLSNFDHMLILVKLRKYPIAFISKPENFRISIVGRYLWNSGFLAIDRQSARNAVTTINETARRIEEGGMCYGVFPEGTRSRTGKLLPFHAGVFHTAARAKSPVLVLHVHGTNRVFSQMPWHATKVNLDILGTIPSDYVVTHTDAQVCDLARSLMVTCAEQYGDEVAVQKKHPEPPTPAAPAEAPSPKA